LILTKYSQKKTLQLLKKEKPHFTMKLVILLLKLL